MTTRELIGKGAFFLLALPVVARASVRVSYWSRRLSLDDQIERLREVPPFRASWLARPRELAGCVDRLLRVLPPRRHGACFRRSLHLLDLWGRCGLDPELRLGLQGDEDLREGHAWIVCRRAPGIRTSSQGYADTFRF
ncbi:MAG: lasso peptide biosynthesis protein [Thermoanaerobaculia bacterium]|nr:lasso peptide biosynthesis protein [Thermoanaerobaculia bacterium]